MNRGGILVTITMLSLVQSGCEGAGQVMVEGPRAVVCEVTSVTMDAVTTKVQEEWQAPVSRSTESPARRRVTSNDVERMEDRYEECRYEECLSVAEEICRQTAAKAKYRAKAWFYKGVIHVLQGDDEQARECFRQAKILEHGLRVDRHRFKPAVVRCFQSVGR